MATRRLASLLPRVLDRALNRALGAVGLVRRSYANDRIAKVARTRAYAGAQASRLTQDWIAQVMSADQAIKRDLRKLRDRSRALVRDFSYASRFVQACAENIAGPHGVRLQVRVATTDGTFKRTLNDEVEEKWAEWCDAENCTVDGTLSFVDLQHLLCETLPQDGAFLVRMVPGFPGNKFRFALQVLDADQLDHELTVARTATSNEIRQGVEVDRWGRRVAYHLWSQHPTEYGRGARVRERVPADDIIHGYIQRRPGQTHGVPWFAPVLLDERMLQGFQEAAVTNARIGASKTFFLTFDPEKADSATSGLETSVTMDVEPGVGQVLPAGYTPVDHDPTYPSGEYDPFTKSILGSVATGLRVSHMTLTGDIRGANYSSSRMGQFPERDAWCLLQGMFIRTLHRRVYPAWVKTSVLAGALDVPPREIERVLRSARWMPRGFAYIDPDKDITARLKEVDAGVSTLTNLCLEKGLDYEEVIAERQREIALAKSAGVPINLGTSKQPNTPTDTNDNDEKDGSADKAAADAANDGDRAGRQPLRLARSY